MTLELIAYSPPAGVWRGIDTAGDDHSPGNVITEDLARRLYEDEGVRWVARYTRPDGRVLSQPQPGGDWQGCYSLSIAESRWILSAGLAIVPVQFGVFGDAARGNDVGRAMAQTHRLLGFPAGVHHFLDVEGGGPARAGAAACRLYIEAAAAAARAGGKSAPAAAGPVPPNPLPRGEAIEQDQPTVLCGIACDTDTMRPDRLGRCPVVVATPEIASTWAIEAMGVIGHEW
jgi:hypothetical protein